MKKTITLALFMLATAAFAQQRNPVQADKTQPGPDPTQLGDYQAPKVTCTGSVSVNIMPTGVIELWNSDFLAAVTDNATPANQIQTAVRKAGAGSGFPVDALGNATTKVIYTCNDLGPQTVELWARDQSGNASFCQTYVLVLDNNGNCNGQPIPWNLEVCSTTENLDGVDQLDFILSGMGPGGPFSYIELDDPFNTGCGHFDVQEGSDVTVAPVKDDNPLNGVTTYDLVLIGKHIEGTEPLNSPYKMIAADADRNGVIDMADIEEFHKLIVGTYTELPNNTSWRFVPKGYIFPDLQNPFATLFPESVSIQNIQSPVSVDFVAIKVGDVNGSAVANNAMAIDERATVEAEIGLPAPNPASGASTLTINMPQAGSAQVSLINIDGRILWNADLPLGKGSNAVEIPAPAGRFGLYEWRVQTSGSVKSGKIIFN